ncbi:rpa1 [Symbiodinium natans]|uniref:DNA-directed RNA polymerase n=1 Tax=Symbiodinium natans TaxID=878477 RepID=A0A812UDZ8_9DINO|nr:rpa1 [Symbiodinium natans]
MPHDFRSPMRLKNFIETTVVRELKCAISKQLSKIVAETKDVKVKVGKRSKVAATGTGDTGADEPAEEAEETPAETKKKKRRKILGAEDKAEEEERAADAEEQADEEEDEDDDDDVSSGMYDPPQEEEEGVEDPDERELERPEEEAEGRNEEEEDEEADDEAKPKQGEDEDDEEDEDVASPKGKRSKKGDTGGTKEAREEDGEDGGSGGSHKAKEVSKKKAKSEGKTATSLSERGKALQKQAEQDLAEALKEDNFVWRSDLKDDALTIIVTHNHAQCPHSLFVGEVLRGVLSAATLQDPACEGVQAVHVKVENDKVSLECEGINLFGLQCLSPALVGHNQIYTNNLRHVLDIYGVEAARASVVREVRGVFGHYGIQVDHRHLSLIADYMAQAGGLRPFNRLGMIHCTSPLLQMSYETTMQFLSTACKEDLLDNMVSPASAIVLGQPPAVGTGVVNLLVDLDPPDPPWKKQRRFKFPT